MSYSSYGFLNRKRRLPRRLLRIQESKKGAAPVAVEAAVVVAVVMRESVSATDPTRPNPTATRLWHKALPCPRTEMTTALGGGPPGIQMKSGGGMILPRRGGRIMGEIQGDEGAMASIARGTEALLRTGEGPGLEERALHFTE